MANRVEKWLKFKFSEKILCNLHGIFLDIVFLVFENMIWLFCCSPVWVKNSNLKNYRLYGNIPLKLLFSSKPSVIPYTVYTRFWCGNNESKNPLRTVIYGVPKMNAIFVYWFFIFIMMHHEINKSSPGKGVASGNGGRIPIFSVRFKLA